MSAEKLLNRPFKISTVGKDSGKHITRSNIIKGVLAVAVFLVFAYGYSTYVVPKQFPFFEPGPPWFGKPAGDLILFEKYKWDGPCLSYETCPQVLKLFYSSRFVLNGTINAEYQLGQEHVSRIVNTMKEKYFTYTSCRADGHSNTDDFAYYHYVLLDPDTNQYVTSNWAPCYEQMQSIEKLILQEAGINVKGVSYQA